MLGEADMRRVVIVDKSTEVAYVGGRIRRRRQELGLKQSEVAAGRYTSAYISALERGLAAPSFASMLHLAKVLKVQPAWLLGGIGGEALDREALARAMHDSDGWTVKGEAHVWEHCNETHQDRYRALVDRYGNAYEEVIQSPMHERRCENAEATQ